MTGHARPPEGVETWTWRQTIAQILSEHHVTFRSRTVIYRRQAEAFYEKLTSALVDAFLPALLAEREKLDRITARLTELGVIAPEGRDPDGERFDVADTVLALLDDPIAETGRLRDSAPRLPLLERLHRAERDRDAAVARAEQAEAERDELRKALRELVRLKDGPRDDAYRAAKDAAWDRARAALSPDPSGETDNR